MKTPEHIHDTVEALRWFVSYYPKLGGLDPRETMEYAANLIEELSKELAEAKELAERRLNRKNFYKERATRHLEEAIYYRLRMKEITRICDKTFEHYEEEIQNERLCGNDA